MSEPIHLRSRDANLLVNDLPSVSLAISGNIRVETSTHRTEEAAGTWSFSVNPHGSIEVAITIPSERYVAAVLTSEAAGDEPDASLRALAIVARSYALSRARRNGSLCDSTRCQALRLSAVPPSIARAVLDTAGETLWFAGHEVPAYFTQNSGGITEDAATVWGGRPLPWLRSHPDPYSQRTSSAWHVEAAADEIRAALMAEGFPPPAHLSRVAVTRRSASGRATRVTIVGDHGDSLELPAGSLRFAINRSLGWNQVRSDLYTVHLASGSAGKQQVEFDGSGYGHGVGLSQAGARVMAAEGKEERSILRFYFPGAEVRISSADTGWRRHETNAWTLISSATEPPLDSLVGQAWQQARSLFPGGPAPRPTLQIFPSTELYRSSTGEPGWTLGATRESRIALQPAEVVARHGGMPSLLLHEMLHVLVEHESFPNAPLWLREGLVESLASAPSNRVQRQPFMSYAEIESELRHPSSFAQAARAHQQSAVVVHTLISIYGPGTVRGWLRRGVPPDALARTHAQH